MAKFDIQQAKNAGYSEAEIADFMSKNKLGAIGEPQNAITNAVKASSSALDRVPVLGSILKSFATPAVKYGAFTGEALGQLGRVLLDPAMRKSVLSGYGIGPAPTLEESKKLATQSPTFLLNEKQIESPAEIAKTGLKATAGAASYAIPAGNTFKAAAGLGAAMGGLASASEGEDFNPVRLALGALGGAAGGGLTYGAIKGVGKLVGGAGDLAAKEADALALKGMRPSPSQITNFERDTGQSLKDVIKKYKFYHKGPDQVENVIDPLQMAFDSIAKDPNKSVKTDDLTQAFQDVINNYKGQSAKELQAKGGAIEDYALRYLDGKNGQIPFSDITSERRVIDKLVKDFKLDPTISGPNEEIRNILQNSIRNAAGDTKVGGKTIADLGKELSVLRSVLPIAEKQGNLGVGAAPIGITDAISSVPGAVLGGSLGGIPGAAVGAIGGVALKRMANSPKTAQVLMNGAESLTPILKSLGENITNKASSKINQTLGALLGSSLGSSTDVISPPNVENNSNNNIQSSSIIGQPPSNTNNVTNSQETVTLKDNTTGETMQVPKSQLPNYGIGAQEQDNGQQQLIKQLALLALQKGDTKTLNALKDYQSLTGDSAVKPPPASVVKQQELAKSGLRALTELEGIVKQDPTAPIKASLPGQPGARAYDSSAYRAVEGLLRARSGAAVPEIEVKRYMKANLPAIGDSQDTINRKLKAFRLDLEAVAGAGGSPDIPSN